MLVGRNEELRLLKQAARADESKVVAIYGRRHVGKTFLVGYGQVKRGALTNWYDAYG